MVNCLTKSPSPFTKNIPLLVNLCKWFFFIIIPFSVYGQQVTDSLNFSILLRFNNSPLQLHQKYVSKKQDTLYFTNIKFYISTFRIYYDGETTAETHPQYHLIDAANPKTFKIALPGKKNSHVNRIQYNIGVDSLASTSGAMDGDLDVTNGMYWAWQSGYINIKIEGSSTSCTTRKNKFQFHIGGYKAPYLCLRTHDYIITGKNKNYSLIFDLAELFSEISLKENSSIMIPGAEAYKWTDLFTQTADIE